MNLEQLIRQIEFGLSKASKMGHDCISISMNASFETDDLLKELIGYKENKIKKHEPPLLMDNVNQPSHYTSHPSGV